MKNRQIQIVVVVALAAVAAAVLFGFLFGMQRSGAGLAWQQILEGVVTGGAVCAAWAVAVERKVAAIGLGFSMLLVIAGLAAPSNAIADFGHSPMGWALILALSARLLVPKTAVERRHPS